MMTRRAFVKGVMIAALGATAPEASEGKSLNQKIVVNIPAYRLSLFSGEKAYHFDVAVGKMDHGRRPTPIGHGVISEKRDRIVFIYDQDIPQLDEKKGKKIVWTHTFDSHGKPVTYKMPYERMRALAMEIRQGHQVVKDFVIHSTTDEYTIGGPASDGCIRLKIRDMLRLYDLVAPNVPKGKLSRPVPLSLEYHLVEVKDGLIVLHANLYNESIAYGKELEKRATGHKLNYEKFERLANEAERLFQEVLHRIRSILRNDWPRNYVPEELKKELHRSYKIDELLM